MARLIAFRGILLQPNGQMHVFLIKPHDNTGHDHPLLSVSILQGNLRNFIDPVQLVEDRIAVHVHGGGGPV